MIPHPAISRALSFVQLQQTGYVSHFDNKERSEAGNSCHVCEWTEHVMPSGSEFRLLVNDHRIRHAAGFQKSRSQRKSKMDLSASHRKLLQHILLSRGPPELPTLLPSPQLRTCRCTHEEQCNRMVALQLSRGGSSGDGVTLTWAERAAEA